MGICCILPDMWLFTLPSGEHKLGQIASIKPPPFLASKEISSGYSHLQMLELR